jgi:hypothetical protein
VTNFTVETVMAPITNGDWSKLRHVTDALPGTILIEDAGEPMLVIPVDAESQRSAAIYVQGAMSVLGLDIQWGRAYVAEDCDVDYSLDSDDFVVVPDFAPAWLEDADKTERARQHVDA